jgi:2-dehydro-3-deoxygluconokinase
MSASYDLLTIGESMLRLSVDPGDLLVDAPAYAVHVAGAESNVAIAVARMGFRVAWLSRLTDNSIGHRITHTISSYGVDCSQAVWTADDRNATYFLEFGAAPRPTRVIYDRKFSAASKMDETTFTPDLIRQARVLHLTGITAALSDGCYRLLQRCIETAATAGVQVVFDVNYRSLLWTAEACRERLTPLLRQVDTLLVSRRDAENVFQLSGDVPMLLRKLHEKFGCRHIAVTDGERGASGLAGDQLIPVPAYPVHMIDRIGAGDSFAAGVICGLLEADFARGVRYGVAMSALQLTLRGDIFRLSRADVLKLLDSPGSVSLIR